MLPLKKTPPPYTSKFETETETETETQRVSSGGDEMSFPDSACSTPYVSAPSSPTRTTTTTASSGYFFSAPASPMHFMMSSSATCTTTPSQSSSNGADKATSFEFENVGSITISSADELFFNGLIRPTKLSTHLQRPQALAPLLDLDYSEGEEEDGHDDVSGRAVVAVRGRDLKQLLCRSLHRKARSLSPLRSPNEFPWNEDEAVKEGECKDEEKDNNVDVASSVETTPSCSASSSRSSSERRNSKKWMFLKDLWLHRSKSEGRANSKDKFWSSISFAPVNKSSMSTGPVPSSTTPSAAGAVGSAQKSKKGKVEKGKKPENGVAAKRRGPSPSAHELHYTANRAQAEEMKKRTYLPYKQGLFGCLGFSSKGYGALNGLARSLNPVSSR